jgi:hypothetical protein
VKNEIKNQIVLSQAPEGPIAGYIVSFGGSGAHCKPEQKLAKRNNTM